MKFFSVAKTVSGIVGVSGLGMAVVSSHKKEMDMNQKNHALMQQCVDNSDGKYQLKQTTTISHVGGRYPMKDTKTKIEVVDKDENVIDYCSLGM